MLAVQYGCERFYTYLMGLRFEIQTDHRPLEAIWRKPLSEAPPRLQRLMLKVAMYDATVRYIPGKSNTLPDHLSRHPLDISMADQVNSDQLAAERILAIRESPIESDLYKTIRNATKTDTEMANLREQIRKGWPRTRKHVAANLQAYWDYRHALEDWDEVLYAYNRIIVPEAARLETLQALHRSHLAPDRMHEKAQEIVIWPQIRDDIRKYTATCTTCQRHFRSNPKMPLQWAENQGRYPMERVGLDMAQYGTETWLIMKDDYYSNLLFVKKVQAATTEQVRSALLQWFAICGFPKHVTADSGACFTSQRFTDICNAWNIQVRYSAPYHHQANGLAESGVKTFKRIRHDATANTEEAVQRAVVAHNNYPRAGKPAPAALFFNRQIADDTIQYPTEMRRGPDVHDRHQQQQQQRHAAAKQQWDAHARTQEPLLPNKHVWFQTPPSRIWEQAEIIKQLAPLNYQIKANDGRAKIRHRQHLRPRHPALMMTDNAPTGRFFFNQAANERIATPPPTEPINEPPVAPAPITRRTSRQNAGVPPARYGEPIPQSILTRPRQTDREEEDENVDRQHQTEQR
jgi:hypothetical protein